MNDEQLAKQLFDRARLEQAPEVDVTARVMHQVKAAVRPRTPEAAGPPLRPMAWVAAFSGAAAGVMVLAAADGLLIFQDPLAALMLDLTWVIL